MAQREVSAGVLIRPDGRFLLALRPKGRTWGGYWEFPGGKIEEGESPLDALKRELKEEIGIEVQQAYPWLKFGHLNFFRVTRWNGEIQPIEEQELSWEKAGNVQVMPLIPANYGILNALSLPSIYAITNCSEMGELHFFRSLQHIVKSGLSIMIQVREKQMKFKEFYAFCEKLMSITQSSPNAIKIILNSYHYRQNNNLMTQFNFDGIHWTSEDLNKISQKIEYKLNLASCHNLAEMTKAEQLGLDAIALSPVQPTVSHPNIKHLGWSQFQALIANFCIPTYALGGMTLDDIETSWNHQGHGIALQRQIWKI